MRKGNMTILASILTIVLIAMAAGAGTMAYFSDEKTSSGNTFTAGTLELYMSGPVTVPMTLDKMKPEDKFTGEITVKNMGNIDGYLYGKSWYTELVDPDPVSDLGTVLNVIWWEDDDSAFNPGVSLYAFTAGNPGPYTLPVYGAGWHEYGKLAPYDTLTLKIEIEFDVDAGNEYQGDSIELLFKIVLHQKNVVP